MFGYRLFNLITCPDVISASAHVITTLCLLLRTGWQWEASLHTQLSVNMCLGFVFVVWPTTRVSAVVHTTPSRPSQLCGEKRTISLPWFISVPLGNFLRQRWFPPPESQEQLEGPTEKRTALSLEEMTLSTCSLPCSSAAILCLHLDPPGGFPTPLPGADRMLMAWMECL